MLENLGAVGFESSLNVDIWIIPVLREVKNNKQKIAGLKKTLDLRESKQAKKFKFQKDYINYVLRHSAVREIISRYIKCSPSEVKMTTDYLGKPQLLDKPPPLHFNCSSSDECFVCAISNTEIGIDLEVVKPLEKINVLAQLVCSPSEYRDFLVLDESDQLNIFYKIWTRKEAFLKWSGVGLTAHLPSYTVWFLKSEIRSQSYWRGQDFSFAWDKRNYRGSLYATKNITGVSFKIFNFD